MKSQSSVLFLGKNRDPFTDKALTLCRQKFEYVSSFCGDWGDPLPESARTWKGDYMISYLSRWKIPQSMLANAKVAAINFHPASPEYPGIGCNNFALYEDAKEYGSTCHHMAAKLDSGPIIAVKRFSVLPDDTVETLLNRTYEHQFILFTEIIELMASGKALPVSQTEKWSRPAFTRDEFNALARLTPDMSQEEMAKRIRATTFKSWKPTLELNGFTFEYKDCE